MTALDSESVHSFKKGSPPSSLGLQTRSGHSTRISDLGSCWGEREKVKYEIIQFRSEAKQKTKGSCKNINELKNNKQLTNYIIKENNKIFIEQFLNKQ
jgi:hypothetical protein